MNKHDELADLEAECAVLKMRLENLREYTTTVLADYMKVVNENDWRLWGGVAMAFPLGALIGYAIGVLR